MRLDRLLESEHKYYKLVPQSMRMDSEWAYYVLERQNTTPPQFAIICVIRI
jgi:hypothetical protein